MPPRLLSHTRQEQRPGPLALDPGNPLIQGLTNWYHVNEGGGPGIYDFARNIGYAPLRGTYSWVGSQLGLGVDFPNGTGGAAPNAWADFGDVDWFEGYSAVSIQLIFRVANVASGAGNIIRHDGALSVQHFADRSTTAIFCSGSGLVTDVTSVTTVSSGPMADGLYHIAHFVYVGSNVATDNHMYIDGVEATYLARTAWSGTINTTGNGCLWAAASSGGESVQCGIGNFAIWNRALSASECAELALDPYQVFLPQTTRRWFTFGPPTIPPGLGPVVQMSQPMMIPPP